MSKQNNKFIKKPFITLTLVAIFIYHCGTNFLNYSQETQNSLNSLKKQYQLLLHSLSHDFQNLIEKETLKLNYEVKLRLEAYPDIRQLNIYSLTDKQLFEYANPQSSASSDETFRVTLKLSEARVEMLIDLRESREKHRSIFWRHAIESLFFAFALLLINELLKTKPVTPPLASPENEDDDSYDIREMLETLLQKDSEIEELKKMLQDARNLKTQFLTTVRHEVRTPVNGILGCVELLASDKSLHQKQKEFLPIIRSCSYDLLKKIEDIITLARLETEDTTVPKQLFCPNSIVHEIQQKYAKQLIDKNIDLEINGLPEGKTLFLGSDDLLGEVFDRLMDNAIKFTEGGLIKISIHIDEENNENARLTFSIKDNGIGISLNHQKIFDSFTQADNSNSRLYEGMGLGLSICQKLLKILGSNLEVESKLNEGSRFYFTIDLEKGTTPEETKALLDNIIENQS